MENFDIKALIDYSKKGILSKSLFKTDKLDSSLFCMAKATEIDNHTSTKQAIINVIEGDGIFKLGSKSIKMHPNTIIHMKENTVHALMAKENTSFILTLIK